MKGDKPQNEGSNNVKAERRWKQSLIVSSEKKIAEFANSVDLDKVAQHEPPHLDLHCLVSIL